MKRRGLVIIYDPHALMQFLQFYCMGDYEAEWDALCLPTEDSKEEMHSYCAMACVFKNIYIGESEYKSLSVVNKLKLFVPMVLYSITGRRKKYCRRTLNQYVENINNYDIVAANTETGFVSGMLASFGKEKTVIYFEDGLGDYIFYRKRWKSIYSIKSFSNVQSVLMARLGYFGKGYTYLKSTRETIKYCSVKEEILYRNYKEIREFAMNSVMIKKFRGLLDRVYPELRNLVIDEKVAVVFTDPVELDCDDWKEYVDNFVTALSQRHNHILLKCHPRENTEKYSFPDNIVVEEIPRNIPAELILPYLNRNECYFMFPNSIVVNMKLYDLKVHILFSEYICEQMKKNFSFLTDRESMEMFCERFIKDRYTITSI